MQKLRCAIYTRKSSDEGLEQGFNSLHAQRESCEAYILSQAGEGWSCLPAQYDDGGFSGGSMERPGLRQLLADIAGRLIDIVVVYKVDRLTRSLADFARIVERFDADGVSFVSVTQAFNTTTSMGRLTLNVLLSFAQFEREVTGERIRDKIAASKAKGLWMGGMIPLGYNAVGRKLEVNPAEAETVRSIFTRYVALGSVRLLQDDLAQADVRSKTWITKTGKSIGGTRLGRGALYHMLSNPVYLGMIRHGERLYENAHPPVIDLELWEAARSKLKENGQDIPATPKLPSPVMLQGLVFDDHGHPMPVVHTRKDGKRYRYYASTALNPDKHAEPGSLARISIGILDGFVIERVSELLSRGWQSEAPMEERVRAAIKRLDLGEDRIAIQLRPESLVANPTPAAGAIRHADDSVELAIGIRLKHRKGSVQIEAPNTSSGGRVDKPLVRAICLTRVWSDSLARGEVKTVKEIADRSGYWDHYVANLMPLAWLAPDLAEAILDGRQARGVTLGALIRHQLPMEWQAQRDLFASLG